MTKCQRQLHSTATATSRDSANSATTTYEFLVQSTGTTSADCGLKKKKKRDGQREDTDARAMYNSMLELRPDVAFINVSGNYITSQTTPREIFDRVVLIVNELQAAGTSTIFIPEIMTRGDFSKSPDQHLDKATFDRKRQKINSLLAKRFKENLIRFSDVRYPEDYDNDQVHLLKNSASTANTGMKKYESRIRRILCSLKN